MRKFFLNFFPKADFFILFRKKNAYLNLLFLTNLIPTSRAYK